MTRLKCTYPGCDTVKESPHGRREAYTEAFEEGWRGDTLNWTLGPHVAVLKCPKHNKETKNGR